MMLFLIICVNKGRNVWVYVYTYAYIGIYTKYVYSDTGHVLVVCGMKLSLEML